MKGVYQQKVLFVKIKDEFSLIRGKIYDLNEASSPDPTACLVSTVDIAIFMLYYTHPSNLSI